MNENSRQSFLHLPECVLLHSIEPAFTKYTSRLWRYATLINEAPPSWNSTYIHEVLQVAEMLEEWGFLLALWVEQSKGKPVKVNRHFVIGSTDLVSAPPQAFLSAFIPQLCVLIPQLSQHCHQLAEVYSHDPAYPEHRIRGFIRAAAKIQTQISPLCNRKNQQKQQL